MLNSPSSTHHTRPFTLSTQTTRHLKGYIIIPFRWLSGTYTHSSWLVVALNLVFCALIVWAHGNLSKILSLLRHPHEIKR
ncbi:TPA: phage holin family protein [Escherichia coli]